MGFTLWDSGSPSEGTGGGDAALPREHHPHHHPHPPVAYVSHVVGALAGLTVGILVLKTFEHKFHTTVLWWTALFTSSLCTTFAIAWNLFN